MEPKLRSNLLALASAFMEASGIQHTTLSQRAAGDWRFLAKLEAGRRFTVRKYDEMIVWFSFNWPAEAVWPCDVPRPSGKPHDDCEAA